MTSRAVDRFVARSQRAAVPVADRRPAPVVVEAAGESPEVPAAVGDPAPAPPPSTGDDVSDRREAWPVAPEPAPGAAPPTVDGVVAMSTVEPPDRTVPDRMTAAAPAAATESTAAPDFSGSGPSRGPEQPATDDVPVSRLRLVGAEAMPDRGAAAAPAATPTAAPADNAIAARLEAAAHRTADRPPPDHRAEPDPHAEPGPHGIAAYPRREPVPAVVVGERSERPTTSTGMGSTAPNPSSIPPTAERASAPTVTIGTIEVITPAAPTPSPRPLDALAARRRSGRPRWTGRAG